MKNILFLLFIFISVCSYAQKVGTYDKSIHATDSLETDANFIVARDTIVPILDVSYHEFSTDSVTWTKDETNANWVRFSNDVKNTWWVLPYGVFTEQWEASNDLDSFYDANSMQWISGNDTLPVVSATGGDVYKVGTPSNNQVGVWTGDGTLEGSPNFTYDGSNIINTGHYLGDETTWTDLGDRSGSLAISSTTFGNNFEITLTGDVTLFISGLYDGAEGRILVHQDATGGHDFAVATNIGTKTRVGEGIKPRPNSDSYVKYWHHGSMIYYEFIDIVTTPQELATSGTPALDVTKGYNANVSQLTGNLIITIANLRDGRGGWIRVRNGTTAYSVNINGAPGYTTEKAWGPYSAIIDPTPSSYTTIFYWRTGSVINYQFIWSDPISGGSGSTDLSFSGSSSPVTLHSSSGADVTLIAGSNVSFSATSTSLTIDASAAGGGDVYLANNNAFTGNNSFAGTLTQTISSSGIYGMTLTNSASGGGALKLRANDGAGSILEVDNYAGGGILTAYANGSIELGSLPTGTTGYTLYYDTGTKRVTYGLAPGGGGGGDVYKVGTPVDNQIGVWTGDGTIEGSTGLTFNGSGVKIAGYLAATSIGSQDAYSKINLINSAAGEIEFVDPIQITTTLTSDPTGQEGLIYYNSSTQKIRGYNGGSWGDLITTASGTGTVTSVGLAAPTGFSVSGSPITNSGTLSLSFAAGYSLPTTTNQTNWTAAYNDRVVTAAVTGTTTKTITLNQQDGGTVTAQFTDLTGAGLWSDGGDFTYLTSTTDRVVIHSATELNSNYVFQVSGGIYSNSSIYSGGEFTTAPAVSGGSNLWTQSSFNTTLVTSDNGSYVIASEGRAATTTFDYLLGNKGTYTKSTTGTTTITLTNLPDGGEGSLEITNSYNGTAGIALASSGYTARKMGTESNIKQSTGLSEYTTIVYWTSGTILYYGYIHEN